MLTLMASHSLRGLYFSDWRREEKHFDKRGAFGRQADYCISTLASWVAVEGKGDEDVLIKHAPGAAASGRP